MTPELRAWLRRQPPMRYTCPACGKGDCDVYIDDLTSDEGIDFTVYSSCCDEALDDNEHGKVQPW